MDPNSYFTGRYWTGDYTASGMFHYDSLVTNSGLNRGSSLIIFSIMTICLEFFVLVVIGGILIQLASLTIVPMLKQVLRLRVVLLLPVENIITLADLKMFLLL